MKKLLFSILVLAMVGCDSGGSSGGGKGGADGIVNQEEFKKTVVGTWASNCQQDQTDQGQTLYYVELLSILDNGTASTTFLIFVQPKCQGQMVNQQRVDFTYKVTGSANGATKMDVVNQGQTTAVTVKVAGDLLTITTPEGKATVYKKQAQIPQ